jgi:molybdenum-dependent DNA-binding transcriptional regulator ModE
VPRARARVRLFAARPGPREREALAVIEAEPGMTVEQLAERMGVSYGRAWQIVARLERSHVRRARVQSPAGGS